MLFRSVSQSRYLVDGLTDEERFNCVISRHCQTMSERQAVLSELASQHSELTEFAKSILNVEKLIQTIQQLANEQSDLTAHAQAMLAEEQAAPSTDSAPAASAQ